MGEQGTDQLRRQVEQGLVVRARDQQAVAVEERAVVEEGQAGLVLEHQRRLELAALDATEGAAGVCSHAQLF